MRALVLSNMLPDDAHPERGGFVRDQVAALRTIDGLEVELCEFPPGARALARAWLDLRRGLLPGRIHSGDSAAPDLARVIAEGRLDVVHAHFGLSAWPALAIRARVRALTVHGTDLLHPRTRMATAAVLTRMDLVGAVSASLAQQLPGGSARRRAQILPCGVDVERFHPIPRAEARAELGLEPDHRYVLFPADPGRPEKRHDRAAALADAVGVELLTLGGVPPAQVPLWVNAADAVVVPSEREGFGLAVLEALACEVPVLATPVGVHPEALDRVNGSMCAPFELASWRRALEPHLEAAQREAGGQAASGEAQPGGRLEDRGPQQGRASAMRFSSPRMAQRVADAWSAALERAG